MRWTASQLITRLLVAAAIGAAAYAGWARRGVGDAPPSEFERAGQRGKAGRTGLAGATPGAARSGEHGQGTSRGAALGTATLDEVLRVSWGSGPGQLGHTLPMEASPEGPMSFAVDREGRVFVLDQVNARVVVFGRGEAPRAIALPTNTYQDIALDGQGGFAVVDRLVTRALVFVSPGGQVRHQIGLEGKGVDDGGDVTGLFARPDGYWVEVGHRQLVRVASLDGSPDDERPEVPGRFDASEGRYLQATLLPDGSAELARGGRDGAAAPFARATFGAGVLQLAALEVDASGRVFVAASLATEDDGPGYELRGEGDEVVVFSPEGFETGRFHFADNEGPEEQVRRLRLGDDGALYHLWLGRDGARLTRYVP